MKAIREHLSLTTADYPTAPGYYWAKWKIADPPTYIDSVSGEEETITLDGGWDIVRVWPNALNWDFVMPGDADFDERFRVDVLGYQSSQPLDCFFWGSGPLSAPQPPKEAQ